MMAHILPTWLLLVPSVLALQIGVFILGADRQAALNKLAFLASIAVSLRTLESNWDPSSFPPAALYVFRVGGVFLPVLCLHVLAAWSEQKKRWFSHVLALAYGSAGLVAVLMPTLPFLVYAVYFLVTGTFSIYLAVWRLWSARGRERARIWLVALSATVAVFSTCALLGMSYRGGHQVHPLSTVVSFAYLAIVASTVSRYRFGSLGRYLRSSAVRSLTLASLAGIYFGSVLLVAGFLETRLRWNPLLVTVCCVLIAGPLYYPLKESLEVPIRRFFPLPRDLYYEGLKRFLREIDVFSPLPDLAGVVTSRLAAFLDLAGVCLLVQPAGSPAFLRTAALARGSTNLGMRFVPGGRDGWTLARLRLLSALPLTEVYALSGRNRSVGLLAVSRHPDGSPLTGEEREILRALAYQAGVAVENAELYAELLAVENYYHTVMQSTANAVLIVNPNGLVVDVNRAAENAFGPATSLIGNAVEDATGQEALSSFARQVVRTKTAITGQELRFSVQGQEDAPYAVSVAPLVESGSTECRGALIALSNLSAIRSLERQVERAERLAALGRLTAGLAHELRNGLNNIAGYATMMADATRPSDPQARFAQGILEDVAGLEGMLSRFLSFAREEKLAPTTISPRALVEKVLEALHPGLRARHIALKTEFDPSAPPAHGDPSQLAQALTNVVLNAAEAMEAGGLLIVGVHRAARGVELRVTDTGPGIPEGEQELIFEPFFTTKSNGTGLGLSITHSIVTRHGGTVQVKSVPGLGTTVSLILPPRSAKKPTVLMEAKADEADDKPDAACYRGR